ncbi:unnamed protein product [Boreogadus saida]
MLLLSTRAFSSSLPIAGLPSNVAVSDDVSSSVTLLTPFSAAAEPSKGFILGPVSGFDAAVGDHNINILIILFYRMHFKMLGTVTCSVPSSRA